MINENEVLNYFNICLNEEDDLIEDCENNETCLISGDRLIDYSLTLSCGHKFNYKSLFEEVYRQKCIINHKEIVRVPHRCIKCPYCRTIVNGILPYRESIVYDKFEGVNWPEKYAIKTNVCSYVFRSGLKKGEKCNNMCSDKYCLRHKTLALKMEEKPIVVDKKKERCNHKIKTKNGSRFCYNSAKEKGYCGIHLKLYNNIK